MLKQLTQALTSPQASLGLVGMMFSLPLIVAYHDIPIPTFYTEWLAATLGLFALAGLCNREVLRSLRPPRISLIFAGLILVCNLQLIFNADMSGQHSLLIQLYLLWAGLLALLGHDLSQRLGREKLAHTLAWSLVIAGAINAGFVALQIIQRLGIELPVPKLQSYGMLAQSNLFADLAGLAMVSLMYLYATRHIRLKALVAGLAAGLLMLTLSGSRSSALYLAMIALLNLVWYLKRRQQAAETSTAKQLFQYSLFLLPLFIVLQLALTAWFPHGLIQTPISRTIAAMDASSASLRWQFWETSLNLFSQSPWLGIGAGQMRWQTYLLVDNPAMNPAHLFFEHAHNLFLHLLAEMGLLSMLLVLAGLIAWGYGFFKKTAWQWEDWWLLGLLGIIGIHSMLEYPLWYAPFLGIFALLSGTGETRSLDLARLSLSARRLLALAIVAALLYGAQQLYIMQIAYRKLEHQIATASQADMTDAQKQQLVEEMLWINAHTVLAPYAQLVLATYMTPSRNLAEMQIGIVESAIKFIPLRKPALHYVILLEMRQRHAEALQHLKRLLLIAGGDLRPDIAQLPEKHQLLLNTLLAELK